MLPGILLSTLALSGLSINFLATELLVRWENKF